MEPLESHTSSSSDALPEEALPPSHYASYDHIYCIQDSSMHRLKFNMVHAVTFFTTCVIIPMIGGFGLHMAFNGRKYNQAVEEALREAQRYKPSRLRTVMHENPVKFARRALKWGTLYAVVGTGTIGLTAVCIWKL